MIGDPNIEYDTPLYDEEGNLIEVIEEDEIFPDDPLPFPELPDEAYEGEMNDLAEQQGEEESNIDPVEEIISSAGEVYSEARNKLVELYTQILTTGEISAEQNVELEQTLFEYSSSYNEIKDKVVEQEQGNNDGVEIEQEPEPIVTDELIEEIIDRLNNGGRNDLLFVDEDGRVLVNGEQVPLLKLIRLDVEQLYADYAQIKVLVADKADIKELNAIKATIGEMDVDIGRIDTLLGGNLTMENMASLILTSKKVTVEDAFIKNAMIDSVSAAKINTGILNTNLVNIQSDDGSLILNGTLQQFKDANGKVRIQMGKDAQGNFTFGLFDETGIGTLIDSTGIKEKAIGDGLIVNKMIGENANISGSKLDINSVVTEVNNGANTIKGTKIKLDEQNQTLDVAFNSMTTTVTEQGKAIGSHTTSINIMQGQIGTLISDTEIIEDGEKVTVKDAYSKINESVGQVSLTVKDVESNFNNMKIGAKNLIANSAPTDLTDWRIANGTYWSTSLVDCVTAPMGKAIRATCSAKSSGGVYKFAINKAKLINGEVYTMSAWVRASKPCAMSFYNELMPKSNLINVTTEWKLYTYTSVIDTSRPQWANVFYVTNETSEAGLWYEVHSLMFENSTKNSNWSEPPEQIANSLGALDTRVKNAEVKLTKDGLTTLIGNSYVTPATLDGKGYATALDVTQASDRWTAKFSESGGYNELYNGNFKNGMSFWSNVGSNTIWEQSSCPVSTTSAKIVGQLGVTKQLYQPIENINYQGEVTLSYWAHVSSTGANGTTNPFLASQLMIEFTDGTKDYPLVAHHSKFDTWERRTLTFSSGSKRIKSIFLGIYNRDTTKTVHISEVIVSKGSMQVPYAPNANEVFDGITNISKNGIEVTATNAGTKTLMSADGFFLKNLNGTNLFKVDKNGLEMTGKVTATSGQVAGFNISGNSLWGGNLGLAGPNETETGIAIWAGNTMPERAPLKIYHSGEFISDGEYYSGGPKTKVSIKDGQINLSDSTGNAINLAPTGVGGQFTVDGHLSCMGGINAQELQLDTSLTVNGISTFNGDAYITGKMKTDTTFIKATSGDITRDFSVGNFGGDDVYGATQGVAYLGNCLIIYGSQNFTGLVANEVKSVTIKFRVNFAMSPYISLTGNTSVPHIIDMGATAVSSTQFTLNFRRTNTTDTTVFWMAFGQRG